MIYVIYNEQINVISRFLKDFHCQKVHKKIYENKVTLITISYLDNAYIFKPFIQKLMLKSDYDF